MALPPWVHKELMETDINYVTSHYKGQNKVLHAVAILACRKACNGDEKAANDLFTELQMEVIAPFFGSHLVVKEQYRNMFGDDE